MAYSISDTVGGFDNNGNFRRVCNWVADKNAGIKILAEKMDQECDNFAVGFENCLTRDGKGILFSGTNFNFNGNEGRGLLTDVDEDLGAVNVLTHITDPTRLFYDIGTVANQIVLQNDYMDSAAVCDDEGYHFYFVLGRQITSEIFTMRFYGSDKFTGMAIVGADGAPIPANTLLRRGVYECVVHVDKFLDPPVKKICILNADVGSGGGGGGISEISPLDKYILVDDDNPTLVGIGLNTAALNTDLEFMTTIAPAEGDTYVNITYTDPHRPRITLNINSVRGGAIVRSITSNDGSLAISADNTGSFINIDNKGLVEEIVSGDGLLEMVRSIDGMSYEINNEGLLTEEDGVEAIDLDSHTYTIMTQTDLDNAMNDYAGTKKARENSIITDNSTITLDFRNTAPANFALRIKSLGGLNINFAAQSAPRINTLTISDLGPGRFELDGLECLNLRIARGSTGTYRFSRFFLNGLRGDYTPTLWPVIDIKTARAFFDYTCRFNNLVYSTVSGTTKVFSVGDGASTTYDMVSGNGLKTVPTGAFNCYIMSATTGGGDIRISDAGYTGTLSGTYNVDPGIVAPLLFIWNNRLYRPTTLG